MIFRSLFTLVALVLVSSLMDAAELAVGFGSADITPDLSKKPVYIAGFGTNRPATKVHDPIMARAIVLSDGSTKIALVSVDLVGLFLPQVEEVRKHLPEFKYILISSTHNHEGPDTIGLWGRSPFTSGVDPDYLKQVVDGCKLAITDADQSLKKATAKLGTAKAPELLHDGRKPIVLHDELTAVAFEQPDGKLAGLLISWHCHPETLDSKNTEISADFVGYTVSKLQELHKVPVVFLTGTVGGLMTSLKVPLLNAEGQLLEDGTFEKTEAYGHAVAAVAERARQSAQPVDLLPIKIRQEVCLIPMENNLYRLAGQLGILQRPLYEYNPATASKPEAWKLTNDLSGPVAVRTEVGFLQLGELGLAAIPGEIYPEIVLDQIVDPAEPGADFPNAAKEPAIFPSMNTKHKMLIGLANDELGYFIPKRQWDEQPPYAYGLKKPQYGEINSIGPEAARLICEAFQRALKAK